MPAERFIYQNRRFYCRECGSKIVRLLWNYDPAPSCACGAAVEEDHGQFEQSATVIQDSIEGGVEIRHGICWPDGTPRTYYSKAEMKRVAADMGLVNAVRHVPERGSDRSRHTSRWV